MQLGMIGLGRMGANIVRRLMGDGHECVVYDVNEVSIAALEADGATGARTLPDFVAKLTRPRAAWVMIPAGITGSTVEELAGLLDEADGEAAGLGVRRPHPPRSVRDHRRDQQRSGGEGAHAPRPPGLDHRGPRPPPKRARHSRHPTQRRFCGLGATIKAGAQTPRPALSGAGPGFKGPQPRSRDGPRHPRSSAQLPDQRP